MKILMLSSDKKIFSTDSRVRQRQLAYGELCDELHIIVPADTSQEAVQKIGDNVWLYSTQTGNKLTSWLQLVSLTMSIKKTRDIDRNDSLITTQDSFEIGLAGWLAAKLTGLPLNLQVHGDIASSYFHDESLRRRLQFWLSRWLIPRAETVRTVSHRVADYLSHWKPAGVYALPIYSDKEEIHQQADAATPRLPFPKTAIIVARLEPAKGVGFAIRSLEETLKTHEEFGLLILGEGSLRESLQHLVADLGLQDKVQLVGWVDNPLPYMKQAHLTLVPSYYEGWGMTPVESLLVGTPVIMTDVGCAGELVSPETGGIVVPVADGADFHTAVEDLLEDESHYQQLATQTQAVAGRINSHDKYLKKLKNIWQQTINY